MAGRLAQGCKDAVDVDRFQLFEIIDANNLEFSLKKQENLKKVEENKVSKSKFNLECKNYIGSNKIYNYYGMIEQTGSIFLECEYGFYHPSLFSEIIIRDENMMPCNPGKVGIIQVCSLLPISYPGHSILTEDLGEIFAIDTCKCGRKGKVFKVLKRIKDSEVRGCSDVY